MRPARLGPLLAFVFAAMLAACGGSGGSSAPDTPPPPASLPLTVKVNNVVVSPSANALTIGNGDTVTIEAARPVTWLAATPGALVTNNVVTSQSWTARLAKPDASGATYTLRASAGTDTTTLTLLIPQGDVRNGEYKLFSANANEYTLRIDFNAMQYTVLSGTTAVSSGPFSGPVDGIYTFTVPGYTPARNNARFRTAEGIIVGSHPLGGAEALPFVAANHFVTSAADLPLTNMWMFASDVAPSTTPAVNSRIMSLRLTANQITYCSVPAGAITTVANCLPANLATHTLTFNADRSMTWLDEGVPVDLHVVRTASGLFLIRAQSYPATTGNKRFQIALDDAGAVATGVHEGGISNGSWGTATLSTTALSREAVTSAGLADNVTGVLFGLSASLPLRTSGGSDGVNYFVLNTDLLGAHIAARGSTKAGLAGIGLRR
jgi:hypothetical protein